MHRHPFLRRCLSLTMGLSLLFSCIGTALAAPADGGLPAPDSAWEHFPSTDGLDTSTVHPYIPSGNWAFAEAPVNTTNFETLTDLYYIPPIGVQYDNWAVSADIAAQGGPGGVYWGTANFHSTGRINLAGDNLAAMVYTAPATGTVTLSASDPLWVDWWEQGPNGVRIAIYKSSSQTGAIIPVWPVGDRWKTLGGSADADGAPGHEYTFEPYTLSIREGEKLYFVMDPNGNAGDDVIAWDPVVTYDNGDYDAENDPALAMPEKAVMADVFPYDDPADNNFTHGNGWRLDAARGSVYTAMNWLNWRADWMQARYYASESEVTTDNDMWPLGVITSDCYGDDLGWHNQGMFLYPAPDGNDVAFTYEAPRDGVLELRFGDATFAQDTTGNVISLAVYKNDVQIWPEAGGYTVQHTVGGYDEIQLELEDVVTAVHAGDQLHIRASLVNSTGEYSLKIMPEAEYTSLEYDASLDKEAQFAELANYSYYDQFSDEQGQDGWYYLYAPIGENGMVMEVPYYQDGCWYDGTWEYIIATIFQTAVNPGSEYDAIIAFKAPYTGTITAYFENGAWVKEDPEGSGDGVNVWMQLSSDGEVTDISPVTYIPNGGSAEFEPVTLNIRKNEYVYFRFNRGEGNPWFDEVNMNPCVKYTSIDFDDPGIEEGPAADRQEPEAGSSLAEDEFPLAGRDYTDAEEYSVTAAELVERIQGGTLVEGAVYEVSDHTSLYFGGINADTTYDLKGICIRTSPSGYSYDGPNPEQEGRFGIFVEGNGGVLTLKNFTMEISQWDESDLEPEGAVNTWNCAGLTLENVEITGTAGYGVHSSQGREGAETNLVNCRIEGSFRYGAVVFDDGMQAGAPSVVSSYIVNTAEPNVANWEGAQAVTDAISSGALIMDSVLEAEGAAVELRCSEAVVQNNTVTGGIALNAELQNVLVALNEVTGGIAVPDGRNTVVLLNTADEITVTGGVSITLAENTVSGAVSATGVNYLLMQDNAVDGGITTTGSENTYGDDLYDPTVREEAGVNEDLLPKPNVDVFAGMEPKTDVRTLEGSKKLKSYLNQASRNQTYAIVPPGVYSSDTLSLAGVENFDLYAYGVAVEFASSEYTVFSMNGCKDVAVYGLSISHVTHANGQGTVIEKGDGYVLIQTDPGYYPDLTDPAHFETVSPFIEAFRPGETVPFADISFTSIEYLGDGLHRCVFGNDRSQELEVGGKITMRGRGNNVVVMNGCEDLRFEDFNILSGAFFAFNERSGGGNTQLYRVAITPKAAPVLDPDIDQDLYGDGLIWIDDRGQLRGPESLLTTADAIHSTNMRVGPQAVSCVFERLTDDGANIGGEFGKVLAYDPETKALTYTDGDNYYPGLPTPFEEGDEIVLFNREGKKIGEAVAASAEQMVGGAHQVILDRDVTIEPGTLIENLSANCAGVTFDNCLMDTTRSRGLLIKAPDATITHCTIRNVGMAAILVKPETKDGWNECGYSQNVTITNNLLENTGFYDYAIAEYITAPISIDSDGAAYTDPAYLMHENILIQGNVIRDRGGRHSPYAVYLHGVQNVKVLDNDFGTLKGLTAEEDTQSPVLINGAYNVEVSDNLYPENVSPKVELTVETRKVFGTDIEKPPIKDYVDLQMASVYTTDGWQVELTLTNVTDEELQVELDFADTCAGIFAQDAALPDVLLDAGETRTFYFKAETMPSELEPPQTSVNVDVAAAIPDVTDGVFSAQVDFNGAVQASGATSTEDIDWQEITGIRRQITDKGELIDAEARFAWDDQNLYMYVAVQDDVHYPCEDITELWDWDSLQIGLAPDRSDNDKYFVYSIGLLEDGVLILVDNDTIGGKSGELPLSQMPSTVVREEDSQTTVYQMTIPWSLLGLTAAPQAGDVGVEIVVHDRDASLSDPNEPGRWESYYMEFFGGVAVGSANRDPSRFGRILLLDEPFVVPGADTSKLEAAIEKAKAIDTSGCTEESVEALNQAVSAAEALLAGELTINDQEAVNAAVRAIDAAIDGLEPATDPGPGTDPDPEPGTDPEPGADPEPSVPGGPVTGEPGVRGAMALVAFSACTAAAATLGRRRSRRRR